MVRFCETGEIEEPTDEQRNAGVAGILIVKHKGGQDHRSGVSEQVLQAGRRLRGFSEDGYFKAIRKACRAAGVHSFGPGQLRHSVATWYGEQRRADRGGVHVPGAQVDGDHARVLRALRGAGEPSATACEVAEGGPGQRAVQT